MWVPKEAEFWLHGDIEAADDLVSSSSHQYDVELIDRTLVLEDYPEANLKWCQSQDIQFMVCPLLRSLLRWEDLMPHSNSVFPVTRSASTMICTLELGAEAAQEPFDNIPEDVITSALCAILDKRNHPLLIHCNKGKVNIVLEEEN